MSFAVFILFVIASVSASLGIVNLMASGSSSAVLFICLILLLILTIMYGGQKTST